MQKFADEALRQLPTIINELRRKSDSSRMEGIELYLKKLYISLVQSPTLEHPPSTANHESPIVSKIQPTHEQLPSRELNTLTISEPPQPSGHHTRTSRYAITTPNAATNPSKCIPNVNFNVDLYGKITHPVEKIITEIPYTDGLSITKLLNFIRYLLQIKDLQQLNDWQILQVILPKCKPPLRDRVLELSLIHI